MALGRTQEPKRSAFGLSKFFRSLFPRAIVRTAAFLERSLKRTFILLFTSAKEFLKDECQNLAAQISYFALFSIFPLILGIVILVSIFVGDDAVTRDTLLRQLTENFPKGTVDISAIVQETLKQTQQNRSLFTIIFFLGLIWGGTGIFDSITNALNKAWQATGQSRTIIESLILRFTMFGIFLLLLIGSIGVSVSYDVVRNFAENNAQLSIYLKNNPIWGWLSIAIPWGFGFVTFSILYRVIPQRKVTWFDVWPGAVVATLLFELVKIGFTFYITKVVQYSYTYGSLAGVVIFIFWLYLISAVFLMGGQVASVHAEMRGDKRPTKLARQGQLEKDTVLTPTAVQIETPDNSLSESYNDEEVACFYVRKPTPEVLKEEVIQAHSQDS